MNVLFLKSNLFMSKMCSCLRQTLCSSQKFFISSRTSSFKFFSAISQTSDKFSNGYDPNNGVFKKINPPKQIQQRHFSLIQSVSSFYDYVGSCEAANFAKQALICFHDSTGMPWSGTIIAGCALMKLLVAAPSGIFQQHLLANIELTKMEFDGKVPSIKQKLLERAVKGRWTKVKAEWELRRELRQEWKDLIVKNNCHPLKTTVLFILQFPFWVILILTIKNIANDVHRGKLDDVVMALQFQVGGPFWCKNLALPDPTLILPTITFLTMLAVTELSLVRKPTTKLPTRGLPYIVNKVLPSVLRLLAVAFFFISAASPSGVSLFWATSSVIALAQKLLLMSPRVKGFLRVPKTPSDFDRPYRDSWNVIVEKWMKPFSRKK